MELTITQGKYSETFIITEHVWKWVFVDHLTFPVAAKWSIHIQTRKEIKKYA